MRITVVTGHYPSPYNVARGTFVYDLVQEFCHKGVQVNTVAPTRARMRELANADSVYGMERSQVRRPRYVALSNKTLVPGVSTAWLGFLSFYRASLQAAREFGRPDLVYAHFLYPAGAAARRIAEKLSVPAIVALGESSMQPWERIYGLRSVRTELTNFTHIIAVSQYLKQFCVDRIGVDENKVSVIPNAVDAQLFYPRDQAAMRLKHGLPPDAFIVAYVGHFNERKGYKRVLQAINRVQRPRVGGLFMGDGPEYPTGDRVLFAGPVPHSTVAELLGAADVFVLPTTAEGSCNAVNEALAVGLPVIVGDIPSIREQVTKDVGRLVDPWNIDEIAETIRELYDATHLREQMSKNAAKLGARRTITARAEAIIEVFESVISGDSREL